MTSADCDTVLNRKLERDRYNCGDLKGKPPVCGDQGKRQEIIVPYGTILIRLREDFFLLLRRIGAVRADLIDAGEH
jgi:hypothetical protein